MTAPRTPFPIPRRGLLGFALGALTAVGIAIALLAGRTASAIAESPSGTQPHHLRVVWTESPQDSATIAWSTREPGATHRVLLDREPRAGERSRYGRTVEATRNGSYARLPEEGSLAFHHAFVDGLLPSTTYWFIVESDGVASPERHFVTAPADDRAFALLAGSDSRSDRSQRRAMNELLRSRFEADAQVIALLHGGDYVYDGLSLELFAEWLVDHEDTTTGDGRVLPIIPTRGNHESRGELFDQVFGWPGGPSRRNWYACRLGTETLLLVLNTETALGGDQADFVRDTLETARDRRWLIASYHQPAFPAVKDPSPALEHWVPLFEEYRVDLVVESDGHVQKRTLPIRGGRPEPDGVVYIGEGGLGVRQRSPDATRWFLQEPGFARRGHHVWRIGIGADAIELEAFGEDGARTDAARIDGKRE
jgi:hypothetical protein